MYASVLLGMCMFVCACVSVCLYACVQTDRQYDFGKQAIMQLLICSIMNSQCPLVLAVRDVRV